MILSRLFICLLVCSLYRHLCINCMNSVKIFVGGKTWNEQTVQLETDWKYKYILAWLTLALKAKVCASICPLIVSIFHPWRQDDENRDGSRVTFLLWNEQNSGLNVSMAKRVNLLCVTVSKMDELNVTNKQTNKKRIRRVMFLFRLV